jgi:hypothetical protein
MNRIPWGWLGASLFVLVTGFVAERLTDKLKAPEAPCLLPGTIRSVSINGVEWRGEACRDSVKVCITGAKPIRRKK